MPKPRRLHFTASDEANQLIASDPLALLIGFALDQQITVQKAFSGPLAIKERIGGLDAAAIVNADLDAVFRQKPAIHRFPGSMAKRVQALAQHVQDEYGGDAAKVWKGARDSDALRANLQALPGFGEMKVASLAAVLAKRFGVKSAQPLVPDHMTLGDVDSPEALAEYQAGKRAAKAARRQAKSAA
ncbi:MAG: HhH-GPD-type base excision DNA repair protein [Solirubrobacteraceae bacterium]